MPDSTFLQEVESLFASFRVHLGQTEYTENVIGADYIRLSNGSVTHLIPVASIHSVRMTNTVATIVLREPKRE
ncbi:MAG TPA: hypothetical protein VGD56_09105 [Gemmatirosa sp.]